MTFKAVEEMRGKGESNLDRIERTIYGAHNISKDSLVREIRLLAEGEWDAFIPSVEIKYKVVHRDLIRLIISGIREGYGFAGFSESENSIKITLYLTAKNKQQ